MKIGNCLKYEPLVVDDSEWDNVPLVIPKMIIHSEKYIADLAKEVLRLTLMDSPELVRRDLSKETKDLRESVARNKQIDMEEKNAMRNEKKKVADDLVQLNLHHVMFKTKISKFIEQPILQLVDENDDTLMQKPLLLSISQVFETCLIHEEKSLTKAEVQTIKKEILEINESLLQLRNQD